MTKILAADDDPGTREFYKAVLSDAGFEVETAEDAPSALRRCETAPPDLLILDVDMPGGGGKRVFGVLRLLSHKGLPIIFITGFTHNVWDFPMTHPNISVLAKPASSAAILSEIRRLLFL